MSGFGGMGEPRSRSMSDPVLLLAGCNGAARMVLCCWDEAYGCIGGGDTNFEPGATLVPAPGGGGSRTPPPEAAVL